MKLPSLCIERNIEEAEVTKANRTVEVEIVLYFRSLPVKEKSTLE